MIFDDDEDIVSICQMILERHNWVVSAHTTCCDIIDKVKNEMPDVILMDNWIPSIGGIDATRLLKENTITCAIPVVYFSANNAIEKLAREAGADTYLAKPFDLRTFENLITRYGRSC